MYKAETKVTQEGVETAYKEAGFPFWVARSPEVTKALCSLEDPVHQAWGTGWAGHLSCSLASCNVYCNPAALHPLGGGLTVKGEPECVWSNPVKFCM